MNRIAEFKQHVLERCREAGEFRAEPSYNKLGDFISLFFNEEPAYEERMDQWLTVYRSMHTKELVGFKIKGAKLLVRDVTADFKILDEKIRIHFILAHAMRPDDNPEVKKFYYNLMEQVEAYEIPAEDLIEC